jgi:hypothetical protein
VLFCSCQMLLSFNWCLLLNDLFLVMFLSYRTKKLEVF